MNDKAPHEDKTSIDQQTPLYPDRHLPQLRDVLLGQCVERGRHPRVFKSHQEIQGERTRGAPLLGHTTHQEPLDQAL